MVDDDERGRQSRFLVVVHDDSVPVKLPDFVRIALRLDVDGIEDGDE